MKQIIASVFLNIKPPKLGNDIFLISSEFRITFIKIGRLYHIAAIGMIGKLVGSNMKQIIASVFFKI